MQLYNRLREKPRAGQSRPPHGRVPSRARDRALSAREGIPRGAGVCGSRARSRAATWSRCETTTRPSSWSSRRASPSASSSRGLRARAPPRTYISGYRRFRRARPGAREALALCRRLGLGLLTVRLEPGPLVEALLDPAEFRPRRRKARLGRLLREFQRRVGDPNAGGANRRKVVTAYRQDALRCADYLGRHGPAVAATVARDTGVARARAMMYADHYGWFERPPGAARGTYALTPQGRVAARGVRGRAIGPVARIRHRFGICAHVGGTRPARGWVCGIGATPRTPATGRWIILAALLRGHPGGTRRWKARKR